jgi:transposase InsO family protein
MKRRGRYGVHMQVYGSILPGAATLARLLPKGAGAARDPRPSSREAKKRLTALGWHAQHGSNVSFTARHFGLSRSTVYDWLKREREGGARALEDRSRRPRRIRQPTWTAELEVRVLELRQANPRWGKDVLTPILRREGVEVSVSMVGRILTRLKSRGRLLPATTADPCIRSALYVRPHARRKPRDYVPLAPGDLVQVDSADVRWTGLSQVYKHFSARDYVSRWDVLGVYGRATAATAASFLEEVLQRMPFEVRAIQVDGGSEFKAEFEAACAAKGLDLFVLPPRSPKLNGRVERAQRTHKEEFYQVIEPPDGMHQLRPQLLLQEQRYNTYRPHQALGYLTPHEWLLAAAERR